MQGILLFIALTITSALGIHTWTEYPETSSVTVALSTIPRGHSTGTGLNPSPTVPSITDTIFVPGGTQSVTVITGPGGTSITVPVTVSTTAGGTSVVSDGTTVTSVTVPEGTTTAPVSTSTGSNGAQGTLTTGTTAGAQTSAPSNAAVSLGHGDIGMKLAVSGIISGSLAFFLGL